MYEEEENHHPVVIETNEIKKAVSGRNFQTYVKQNISGALSESNKAI